MPLGYLMSNFNEDSQKLKELYLEFQNKSKQFSVQYNKELKEVISEYLKYTNRYYNPESNIDSISSFEEGYFDITISESFEKVDLDFPENLILDSDNFLKPFRSKYQEKIENQRLFEIQSKLLKEIEEKKMLLKLKAKYE